MGAGGFSGEGNPGLPTYGSGGRIAGSSSPFKSMRPHEFSDNARTVSRGTKSDSQVGSLSSSNPRSALPRFGTPSTSNGRILGRLMFANINLLLFVGAVEVFLARHESSPAVVFCRCLVGLVPLAKLLGDATLHLVENSNETIGGLLNATFTNAAQLIITLSAIKRGLLDVVRHGLLGCIVSDLLLVLGAALLAGGWRRREQHFPEARALVDTTALLVGVISFSLPMVSSLNAPESTVLKVSRVNAIFIAVGYVAYLVFHLHEHARQEAESTVAEDHDDDTHCLDRRVKVILKQYEGDEAEAAWDGAAGKLEGLRRSPPTTPAPGALSVPWALGLLGTATAGVAFLSEVMADSISGLVEDWGVSHAFVGVVLLPLVGNVFEHASAIQLSCADKTGSAVAVAVGSAAQVTLLVAPASVLVAWALGQPLSLDFHPLALAILLLSVLTVLSVILDGKANWLEGFMLMLTYCLVAVLYWYTPGETTEF